MLKETREEKTKMESRLRGKLVLLFMTFALVLALPTVALADLVKNEVTNGVGGKREVTLGESTSVNYWIHKTGGTCDATIGSAANVFLKVSAWPAGGAASDIEISPASQSFTACDVSKAFTFSTANAKVGNYTIAVDRVEDSNNGGDSYAFNDAAFTLQVNAAAPPPPPANNAPVVDDDAQNVNGAEGDTLQNSGSFSDPDGDSLSLSATGPGQFTDNGNGTWSWSLATTDDASGSVTVTASDGKGGTVSDSFNWSASNVAPTANLNAPNAVNEGTSFNLSLGNVQDPGSADTHEYRFDCGSGYGAWGTASSASCAAGDGPGSLGVKGEVRDDDGGSNEYTSSVRVDNVAPTANLNAPNAVNEGTSFNVSLTNPSDPSAADTAAGFTYAFNCGDSSGYGAFGSSASASCPTDDNGLRSVGAKIRDKDGDVSTYSGSVRVDNVAPVLGALSLSGNTGTACIGGNNVNLSFSFSDVGSADTHTGTIDWGDGSSTTAFTNSSVSESHLYSPGTYTINVNVSDDDGGSDRKSSANNAVSFAYNLSGLLAPVNANGSSIFKYGSTIPMKVKILDCENVPVSGLSPSIKFQKMSGTTPVQDINESVSTSAADTNNVMRYSDGQYIYNLNTKNTYDVPDPTATYRAVISEGNSTPKPLYSQNFSLKK